MKLLIHELKTELSQLVTVKHELVHLHALRPHLYKHNQPQGRLYMEVQTPTAETLATSEEVEITDISEAAFFHGMVRFLISTDLRPHTTYRVVLKALNYTFSENAYVGWVNDYNLRIFDVGYDVKSPAQSPFHFEPWILRDATRKGL